jgi:hypothetical protein
MYAQSLIPPTMTVSRALRLFPATVRVFSEFGINAGCCAEITVAEAASRGGADPVALLGALNRLAEQGH